MPAVLELRRDGAAADSSDPEEQPQHFNQRRFGGHGESNELVKQKEPNEGAAARVPAVTAEGAVEEHALKK